MRGSLWALCILATLGTHKGDNGAEKPKGPVELFCVDGVSLFFISPDKVVTSNPNEYRFRMLRLQDGNLLLYVHEELGYPFDPYFTPVFLSEEEKTILLPDLETAGAAIGLKLPPHVFHHVHNLLHEPPPPEHVIKVLSKADEIAERLIARAEMVQGLIKEKADAMQVGDPAAPVTHPYWSLTAHYLALATRKVDTVVKTAVDLVGQAFDKVEELLKLVIPKWLTLKAKDDESAKQPKPQGVGKASIEAMDTIIEALQTSAMILGKSLKENTVKVVQHKYGQEMGKAMEDLIEAVENTWTAVDNLDDVMMEGIAEQAVAKVVDNVHGPPPQETETPLGKCKGKKEL